MFSTLVEELYRILDKGRVYCDPASCLAYSYDNSRRQAMPDAVVFPSTHEEVVQIVRVARKYAVPLIPRGLGSNTTGATIALRGGIVISFEQFNRLIRIDAANQVMVVEPGITNHAVQEAAQHAGFFWAPDPGSAAFCTVGGNLGCNAAGPRAVKYGATRDNVLGLTVVTGSGTTIRTGGITSKAAVGYDLTRLLIGSEGTLGIITQAILKLMPLPEANLSIRIAYKDMHEAVLAVTRIMAGPIIPAALEFLDKNSLLLIKKHAQLDLPTEAQALLLIKVDGLLDTLGYAATVIQQRADSGSVCLFEVAEDEHAAQRFWQARKALSPLLRTLAPNKINEDVIVPISQVAHLVDAIESIALQHDVLIVNFGHAGNGNIHVNILYDEQMVSAEKLRQVLEKLFKKVIELGGTISGEHGIGVAKKEFLQLVCSADEIQFMQEIKKLFDPDQLLNPGKIF